MADTEYQRKKEAALAQAERLVEQRHAGHVGPSSSLPNFTTGPGMPLPLGYNFYQRDSIHPEYVICSYGVWENNYDRTNEDRWFESALLQIRALRRDSFPNTTWFAVAILNKAEHKNASSFESSYKVARVFAAAQVFNIDMSIVDLINRTPQDRHPFSFDANRSVPQHWAIVERHAAKVMEKKP